MPAPLRRIEVALRKYGVELHKPKGGSHWLARRDGYSYPVPAHNGRKTEISDHYIRHLCRTFDISYQEFRKKL